MAFDKTLPDGDASIGIGDNVIRDNNAALDDGLNLEHYFTTGGNQVMRHRFARDTLTNRTVASPVFEDGSIFFQTDLRSGRLVIQVRDGGAWENVDIEPMDSATSLIPTLPRLDSRSDFITCQFATYDQITPTVDGAGPDEIIAIDLALSPFKYATLEEDTTISNPINSLTGKGTTVALELVQDVTGGHIVTFGNAYRTPGGVVPSLDESANARTMVYFTVLQANTVLVTTVPGILAIP